MSAPAEFTCLLRCQCCCWCAHTQHLHLYIFFMCTYSFRSIIVLAGAGSPASLWFSIAKISPYCQEVEVKYRWHHNTVLWLDRPVWELAPSSPPSHIRTENHDIYVKLLHTVCQYFPRVCRSGCSPACVICSSVTNESRQLVSTELARPTSTAPPQWFGHPWVARVLQSPSIIREPAELSGGLREWR